MSAFSLRSAALCVLVCAASPSVASDTVRLHTVGLGGTRADVLAVAAPFEPTTLRTLGLPSDPGLAAIWQLPMGEDVSCTLGLSNGTLRFVCFDGDRRVDGEGASREVDFAPGVREALTAEGGLLSPGARVTSAPTMAVTRLSDLRHVAVLASTAGEDRRLTLLELEGTADGRSLTVASYGVALDAPLPPVNAGLLGVGYNRYVHQDGRARLVTGSASKTYVFGYDPAAPAARIAATPLTVMNPAGKGFLAAGPGAGAELKVLLRDESGSIEGLRFDGGAGKFGFRFTYLGGSGPAVAAFDPYDRDRLLVVLPANGVWATVFIARDGAALVVKSSEIRFTGTVPPPVALLPGGDGVLVGRTESADALYRISADGTLTRSELTLGSEPHAALALDVRRGVRLTLSADPGPDPVDPDGSVTYRVTRTPSDAPFLAAYEIVSRGEVPVANLDFYGGIVSGSVKLGPGQSEAAFTVRLLSHPCRDSRTFVVRLTNDDAALTNPEGIARTIPRSDVCAVVVEPLATPILPGGDGTFRLRRTFDSVTRYRGVRYTVDAAPGLLTSPSEGTVDFAAGELYADVTVRAAPYGSCRPAVAFHVRTSSSEGRGTIAPPPVACGARAEVVTPEEPFLPGDVVVARLDEAASGTMDLDRATWFVTGDPAKVQLLTGSGPEARIRLLAAGVSHVLAYSVPYASGGRPEPDRGEIAIATIAPAALAALDGPVDVVAADPRGPRRFRVAWRGSRRAETFMDGKTYVWKRGGSEVVTCRGERACRIDPGSPPAPVRVEAAFPGGSELLGESTPREVPPPDLTKTGQATRVVPVVLEARGLGAARFETELTLVNGGSSTAEVELAFQGRGHVEWVGGGRQVVLARLIERLRESAPELEPPVVGPLTVTFRNVDADGAAEVLARTTTPSGEESWTTPRGRAGVGYRGLRMDELFGDPGSTPRRHGTAVLIGLRGTSGDPGESADRTNVALVNPGEGAVDVELAWHGADGALLGSVRRVVPGGGLAQEAAAPVGGVPVAYAEVIWRGGGVFTAYATVVDNRSNDGSFVLAQPLDETTLTDALVLPIVLELPRAGSRTDFTFLTDLTLTSPGGFDARLTLFPNTGFAVGLLESVAGQVILGDATGPGARRGLVQVLRERGNEIPVSQGIVFGLARIEKADGGPFEPSRLLASLRVAGPPPTDPDGSRLGRDGVSLPATAVSSLTGLARIAVHGLRQDAEVRSNLAIYNPADSPVELRIELRDAGSPEALPRAPSQSGLGCTVAGGKVVLGPHTFCQLPSVLSAGRDVPEDQTLSGYALVSRAGARTEQPFGAYGVLNDGSRAGRGTGDGSILPPFLTTCAALGIRLTSPDRLPEAALGTFYGPVRMEATPGSRAYLFTASGLPEGLSLVEGTIAGTPRLSGTFEVRVDVADQVGCTGPPRSYTLTVR